MTIVNITALLTPRSLTNRDFKKLLGQQRFWQSAKNDYKKEHLQAEMFLVQCVGILKSHLKISSH